MFSFSFAFARTRTPLPGGGSVVVPGPYKSKTDYPNYANRAPEALIAYRKWDSTMSGYPECDGMVAVSRPDRFESLDRFVQRAGAALSVQWSDATKIPGQPWDGNEKHYPLERGDGPNGQELTRQMAVHRVGFFKVYDEPAQLYAVAHRRGVHVAVWLYDKHGAVTGARKLADKIAASFQAS